MVYLTSFDVPYSHIQEYYNSNFLFAMKFRSILPILSTAYIPTAERF